MNEDVKANPAPELEGVVFYRNFNRSSLEPADIAQLPVACQKAVATLSRLRYPSGRYYISVALLTVEEGQTEEVIVNIAPRRHTNPTKVSSVGYSINIENITEDTDWDAKIADIIHKFALMFKGKMDAAQREVDENRKYSDYFEQMNAVLVS